VFNNFRGTVDGEQVDDNEILEVLRTSDDPEERRRAWEAAKQIGPEVADQVRELARLRNRAARALGYRDHFALALATSELDEERLFATLDQVDQATARPFTEWKAALDTNLAARFGCDAAALRPWHLDDPFFQSPPADGAIGLDHLFADADLEALTLRTYDGLGLDLRPVLERSDLYARAGKSQHAFCIDIDRSGDVRVLCNVEPSERWMDTMLHEFGHAVYDRESDTGLPWLLRGATHPLTTEGIAMLMGRLPRDPAWLGTIAAVDADTTGALAPDLAAAQRAALLTFARWVLVMTTFERALYADPDADLDTLWWDLVERHQQVHRPDGRHAPDWAAKIHLAVAPVYYQNYLYGELFASQLHDALDARAGGIVDRRDAGDLMVREVFAPGASKRWDHLVVDATGEPLSADAFARQLRGA
jgi:peptidyl-dipeptidase A